MTGNLWLNLISLAINFFMSFYNLFAPLDLVANLVALEALVSARIPTLLTYLGYVSFFIPLSYLAVPVALVTIYMTYRVLFALVHFISGLIQTFKIF